MADKIINFRIPVEWIEQIGQICAANGITFSEWGRAAFFAALENTPGNLVFTDADGYKQARALASKLAHAMLERAQLELPDTYEEAAARYGFDGTALRDPNLR